MSTVPVTDFRFSCALRQGLGRAFLQVRREGLRSVAPMVLEACLENQSYDAQCEPTRSEWLYRMFAGTREESHFAETIVAKTERTRDCWDLAQLAELVALLAADGNVGARTALHSLALKHAASEENDWIGVDELLATEGVASARPLVRAYGRRLLVNPEEYVHDLTYALESEKDQALLGSLIEQWATQDPESAAYAAYLTELGSLPMDAGRVDRNRAIVGQSEPEILGTAAEIVQDARQKIGEYPGRYMRFGKKSSVEARRHVYEELLKGNDAEVCMRLLWVFRRAKLPFVSQLILNWTSAGHPGLRSAAVAALGNVRDSRIRKVAREKIGAVTDSSSREVGEAIEMLGESYHPDDASLIVGHLPAVRLEREEAHDYGFSILRIAERHTGSELVPLLRWVYESNPCANCRMNAIEQIAVRHAPPDAIVQEARYDSSEDIRRWACDHIGIPISDWSAA